MPECANIKSVVFDGNKFARRSITEKCCRTCGWRGISIMKYGELSERILRKYYGGTIPQNNRLQQEDIDWLIVDAANYLIRSNLYQAMQQEGRRVIDPLFIQTYPDVPILRS